MDLWEDSQINAAVLSIQSTMVHYNCALRFRFESGEKATIISQTLSVDKELQTNKIQKWFEVENNDLVVRFRTTELKLLRVSVSSLCDMAAVAVQTLEEFS